MLFNLLACLLPDFPRLQPSSLPRYVRELLCGCFIKFGRHLPNRSVCHGVIKERLVPIIHLCFVAIYRREVNTPCKCYFFRAVPHPFCLCCMIRVGCWDRPWSVPLPQDARGCNSYKFSARWILEQASGQACFGKRCNWILFPNWESYFTVPFLHVCLHPSSQAENASSSAFASLSLSPPSQ